MCGGVVVAVGNGIVFIQRRFPGIDDPVFLKPQVTMSKRVIDIEIHAMLFASVNRHRVMALRVTKS